MKDKKVCLFTTLGVTPQVITETIDALCHQKTISRLDKLVIITTNHERIKESVNKLLREFDIKEPSRKETTETGSVKHIYGPSRYKTIKSFIPSIEVTFLPFNDIQTAEDNNLLFREINCALSSLTKDFRVIVSIAGGRKTMSSLLYLSAQINGVEEVYHILTTREVESSGEFHPPSGSLTLIKVPVFEVSSEIHPELKRVQNLDDLNEKNKIIRFVKKGVFKDPTTKKTARIYLSEDEIREVAKLIWTVRTNLSKPDTSQRERSILITGETGSGKEMLARFIHYGVFESTENFFPVNVGAKGNADIFESEFFGHKKGAFTGAETDRPGILGSIKDKSTVFLDEIGDLSEYLQSKLLRVIEYSDYKIMGDDKIKNLDKDILFILATNKEENVREDLKARCYNKYRIPPLREKKNIIIKYLEDYVRKSSDLDKEEKKEFIKAISALKSRLFSYSWPSNFRELDEVINDAVNTYKFYEKINARESLETALNKKINSRVRKDITEISNKKDCERYLVKKYFKETGGKIQKTAELSGFDRKTVRKILKDLIQEMFNHGKDIDLIATELGVSPERLKGLVEQNE